jgi:hypothetical protein
MLDISGKSLPEDINLFYTPLEDAVIEYIKNPQTNTTINFDLIYLNSSSTKRILEIITYFELIFKQGFKVSINWFYGQYDDDMREEGEGFAVLTELPVNIISKSE